MRGHGQIRRARALALLVLTPTGAHSEPAALPSAAATAPLPAADTELPWKLTIGEYFYSTYRGNDFNVRWRRSDTSAWLGVYRDPVFGTQIRTGADTSVELSKSVQLQPSIQLASQGLVGGSLNLQVGNAWYAILGIGRTNTKPYFNLNFDPNDAITVGAGHRRDDGTTYNLFLVADDRLHTRQRDWHFNIKLPLGDSHATFDILRKSGLSDAGYITGWGFSANWDRPRWFLRAVYDPYQNFSVQNVWRLASGIRF